MFQEINPLNRPTAIAEIIVMLLVASILAFFIGWLIQKLNLDKLKADLRFSEDKYNILSGKLVENEKENRELVSTIEDLRNRKDNLLKEFETYKTSHQNDNSNSKSNQKEKELEKKISELNSYINRIKTKNESLKKKLVEEHQTSSSVDKLKKEIETLKTENTRLANQHLKDKQDKLDINSEELEMLKNELKTLKQEKISIDNAFELIQQANQELSTKLTKLDDEKEVLISELNALKIKTIASDNLKPSNENKIQLTKEEIKSRKQQLIANIGSASELDKDLLSKINGIGPFIEAKLNSIGIYTYQQISSLSSKDVELVTELIEFFPGRIEQDGWVKQAQEMGEKVH